MRSLLLPAGASQAAASDLEFPSDPHISGPLVSCLMVTRGAEFPARFAIECFQRQTYENRELVIVCDMPESPIERFVALLDDPQIRYAQVKGSPLGALRNESVKQARGALFAQWDDDDLYHPERLALQVGALAFGDAQAVFLERWLMWWPARRLLAVSGRRIWEGSMLARRGAVGLYPQQAREEDTHMVEAMRRLHAVRLVDRPGAYCYVVHGSNSCDEAHMEMLFSFASERLSEARYEDELSRLEIVMPFAAYAATLAG